VRARTTVEPGELADGHQDVGCLQIIFSRHNVRICNASFRETQRHLLLSVGSLVLLCEKPSQSKSYLQAVSIGEIECTGITLHRLITIS